MTRIGIGINFFIDRDFAVPCRYRSQHHRSGHGLAETGDAYADAGGGFNRGQSQINPALTNIRSGDVLNAITKTADKPIYYSILDYAVVFSPRGQETVPLETRAFHLDPNTFRQKLERVTGVQIGTTNDPYQLQIMVRQIFSAAGVDFPTNIVPGGTNSLAGTLIRGGQSNLFQRPNRHTRSCGQHLRTRISWPRPLRPLHGTGDNFHQSNFLTGFLEG